MRYRLDLTILSFVAVFALGIGVKILSTTKESQKTQTEIFIPLAGVLRLPLDPQDISSIANYHIHHNLWDRLVSPKSGGIAQQVDVSEDGLLYNFKLRPDTRFSNGRSLRAVDVKFSIDRLIKRGSDGHANAKKLIQSIELIDEHELSIRLHKPVAAFLYLLSLPEYGIVPQESCDEDGALKSLDVTSGAYRVKEIQAEKQLLVLQKNIHFVDHESNSPDLVKLQFLDGDSTSVLVESVVNTEANFTELGRIRHDELQVLKSKNPEINFSYTRPSLTVFAILNPELLKLQQRLYLSSVLVNKDFDLNEPFEIRSRQLLPKDSFGSLENDELPKIATNPTALPETLIIRHGNFVKDIAVQMSQRLLEQGISSRLITRSSDETPHIDVRGLGMNNNHPEIGLHLAALSRYSWIPEHKEIRESIEAAFHSINDTDRSQALKKVGSTLLSEGFVIPLALSSYIHLYRKSAVNIDLVSSFDGDIPLWKLRLIK